MKAHKLPYVVTGPGIADKAVDSPGCGYSYAQGVASHRKEPCTFYVRRVKDELVIGYVDRDSRGVVHTIVR